MRKWHTWDVDWVFDLQAPNGIKQGGGVADHLFARNIDSFVRETAQNSNDQRRADKDVVKIQYSLHTISDDKANDFLDAIGWNQLKSHLEAVAATKALSRVRIKNALRSVDGPEPTLRVLVLSDFNTKGLYGDERAAEPNYANLVRHVLMTDDGEAQKGGAYGLGKSVLWAFSDISTVLFSSLPILKPGVNESLKADPAGVRFAGRSSLASHEVAGVEYEPNGLFGEKVTTDRQLDWARSVRGNTALDALPDWLVKRRTQPFDTGTSVVIPFFAPPGQTEASSPKEVCDSILKAANLWYWPAIQSHRLEITVAQVENGQVVDEKIADGTHGVSDFVKAWGTSSDALVEVIDEELGVAEKLIPVTIPGRKPTDVPGASHDEISAPARLRVIRIDDSTSTIHGSVALVRGPGMVVKYLRPPGLGADVPGFVGVFEAGNRYPNPNPDHEKIERFLKAAEPPAHDEWDCHTDRIGVEYKQGSCARIREMKDHIASGIREVLGTKVTDNDDGPTKLSKKFDLPGELPQPSTRLTMKLLSYDSGQQEWIISATMTVDPKIARTEWIFEYVAQVDNSFGASIPLTIKASTATSPNGLTTTSSGDSHAVRVPSGIDKVTVQIVADASATGIPDLMRDRVKVAISGTAVRV